MTSYKCQCGLINWTIDDLCKRCGSPNPYTGNQNPAAFQAPANNFQTQQPPMPAMPDFSSPPPNAFGSAAGTLAPVNGYSNQPPNSFQPPPAYRGYNQPAEANYVSDEMQKAEKQIRNAYVSGTIVCVITVLFALLMSKMASSKDLVSASPAEMFISVAIIGGLTLGVYFKSRVCAVLLCVLFILDKILTFAATGKMSGAILAFVFIYYFAYGIQGTFTYQKLKNQR